MNERAPFQRTAVVAWIAKIDGQIAIHAKRMFPENARVLAYFQRARDVLLRIRAQGGSKANEDPARLAAELDVTAPGLRNFARDGSLTNATDAEMKAFLQPTPAKSPAEALQTSAVAGVIGMGSRWQFGFRKQGSITVASLHFRHLVESADRFGLALDVSVMG